MNEFRTYGAYLRNLSRRLLEHPDLRDMHREEISSILAGEPMRELMRLVPLDRRREAGAFFTTHELAEIAISPLRGEIDDNAVLLDTSCGAGDLLLAATRVMQPQANSVKTFAAWQKQIHGLDIYSEFTEVAKFRLLISALAQGITPEFSGNGFFYELFPNIIVQNGLKSSNAIRGATHILLNPPYVRVSAPAQCTWASGKVSLAALFVDACIAHAKPGTRIIAILPDVLRSGSHYKKWRAKLESSTQEIRTELYGQFDKWADVHVFVLDIIVGSLREQSELQRWRQGLPSTEPTVSDCFEVRTGPVVDYRDPHTGDEYSYVTPAELPPWETVTATKSRRRFSGRVFQPPFVAVRRTSRLEDKNRAVGTIVNISGPVAVENHLLVLLPKNGSIEECNDLLEQLETGSTTDWLNERIRCRHLTVSSLKQLPWKAKADG